MQGDVVTDITGILGAIERSGGYAAILGLVLLIGFWLTRRFMADQRSAAAEREAMMQRRLDAELARSRSNLEEHRSDKALLIGVVQENSKANAALAGAVDKMANIQAQTNQRLIDIDKHLIQRSGRNNSG